MKSIMLHMACMLMSILWLPGQTNWQAQVNLRYPQLGTSDDMDEIVFHSSEVKNTQAGHYTLVKQDWRAGDLSQLLIENPEQNLHAYFISTNEASKLRHYAPSTGMTGVSATRLGNKIALPGVHNGFAFNAEQQLFGVLLLSTSPLEAINQQLLEFNDIEGTLPEKVAHFWGDQILPAADLTFAPTQMQVKAKGEGIVPLYLNIVTNSHQQQMGQNSLHVLTIGPSFSSLQFTEEDARDVAHALKRWEGSYYPEVYVDTLIGNKATAAGIQEKLAAFRQHLFAQAQPNDKVIVFVSTHGLMIDEEMFLQGSDFDQMRPRETAVSFTDIYLALRMFSGEKVILMDAAAAPAVASYDPRVLQPEETILPISTERFYPIFSNRPGELSYEDPRWQNGAFTEALLEIFNGQGGDQNLDHSLRFSEMLAYLHQRTAELAKQVMQKAQHPIIARPAYLDFAWF